jgi:hypothetical protein
MPRRRRHEVWFVIAVLAGLIAIPVAFLQPAFSQNNPKKIPICHRTSSETHPYVSQSPSLGNNGDLNGGHLNHTGPVFTPGGPRPWGDIIPPYTYVDSNGNTQEFPGYNWSADGQAIFESGCGPPPDPLTPTLQCVDPRPSGGFLAHFGYTNPNAFTYSNPVDNYFEPPEADGEQPTVFQSGTFTDVFQVASGGGPLTWHLTGNQATATAGSHRCQGSITIVKALNPSHDHGRFNLEIDGRTAGEAAAVGDGGTTGTIAVDAGERTVGESAAGATDLSNYDIQTVCRDGSSVVAEGNGPKLSVRVGNGRALVCTITNTRKETNSVTPELECVVFRSGIPETAVWGYSNPESFPVTIKVGPMNRFSPAPEFRGQPTEFQPGRLVGVFQTSFSGTGSLAWTLGNKTVTADGSSTHCTATLELRKVTVPADDPGLFNLQINGQLWAVGGNGTTTGPVAVGVGEGTVSESAGPGTDLADYDSTVTCTRNGTVEVSVPGTKVDGAIAAGDVVVCTFTNTRKSTAPEPGPEPPIPPQPPLPPPPPPPVPLGDLSIVKTASPTTQELGKNIRWTIKVKNNSSIAAADVDVVRVSERAYRLKVISIEPSQGTCSLDGSNLGRLAPGASATITVVTRAIRVGLVLNVVRVSSEEQESNYLNNVASALARVTDPVREGDAGAVKGADADRACSTLTTEPRSLPAGSSSIVLATALNRYGKPLRGLTVHASGFGLQQRALTDRRGVARFSLTPARQGIMEFRGGTRLLAAGTESPCRTLLAVLGTSIKPVTG